MEIRWNLDAIQMQLKETDRKLDRLENRWSDIMWITYDAFYIKFGYNIDERSRCNSDAIQM